MKYPWRILGHQKIIDQLEEDLRANRLAQSYLFFGPKEIGKYRLAKTFAMLLQCEHLNLCRTCESCQRIEKNVHPSTITVDRLWTKDRFEDLEEIAKFSNFDQSHRKKSGKKSDQIGIEDIGSITSQIWQTSTARFKICIIRDLERLTEEAMNSFLKTLEEPPEKTIFLLTATHPEALLPTLVSRTRLIEMPLVSNPLLEEKIREIAPSLPAAQQEKMLTLAQGRPARVFRYLENPELLQTQENLFNIIAKLLKEKDLSEAFQLAEDMAKPDQEEELFVFLDALLSFLRTLLREKTFGKSLSLGNSLETEKILALLEKTEQAKFRIERNINRRLTLESLFLAF